jgi:membrane protein required for colicin V production
MTLFDIIAGLLLIASGVFGFVRGFTREVTTVLAFIAAAEIAIWGLRFSGPLVRDAIHTPWLAYTAAVLAVFIIAYVILRLLAGQLTQRVRQTTALSSLDRVLGLGVGLVRGAVIVAAFALLIIVSTPPERVPPWLTEAKLWPLAKASASVLKTVAPDGLKMAKDVAPSVRDAFEEGAKKGEHGYDERQRKSMDDLVEKSR